MTIVKKARQQDMTETIHDENVTRQLDLHIGNLIKRLRIKSGITQVALSKGAGVSLAQIQKYENGTNRVSASRLYWFARTLRTSPNYFYDSFVTLNQKLSGLSDNAQDGFEYDDEAVKASLEMEKQALLSAYFSIDDPEKREWHLKHIRQDSLSDQ